MHRPAAVNSEDFCPGGDKRGGVSGDQSPATFAMESPDYAPGVPAEDFEESEDDFGDREAEEREEPEFAAPEDPGFVPEDAVTPRTTAPFFTKYEVAKIIGVRATQLSRNAPVLVPLEKGDDPHSIATREFLAGVIPFIIRRPLPSGKAEYWHLDELKYLPEVTG